MAGLSPLERILWLGVIAGDRTITEAGLRVAMSLALHQNSVTGRLNPGIPLIAKETALTERGVSNGLNMLKKADYLKTIGKNPGGRSNTNRYLLVQNDQETLNHHSVNSDSVNGRSQYPEPPFAKTLNDGSPKQGIEQGSNKGTSKSSASARQTREILDYLNTKTGKGFKPVETNLKLIRARLIEGHSSEDIFAVIDRKTKEWSNTKYAQYLRPATLFGAEKFNQYVGEIGQPLPTPLKHQGNRPFDDARKLAPRKYY